MIAQRSILSVLLTLLLAPSSMAAQGFADRWTDKEMGKSGNDPKGLTLRLRLQPPSLPIPPGSRCRNVDSPECMFRSTYFLGDGFDPTKKQRLNILFVPGGPGAIVDTSNSSVALKMLERRHNVVYFHPRGMGQSAIDGDNEFDQFLRADYIIDDIEMLRLEILKTRPWDAIYGHSWGTTIAQRYAARFGKPKDPSPKVMSLVLSGPVDRHRANTQGARSQMVVENLKMIFDYYRSRGVANCQCGSATFLKKLVMDFSAPQIPALGNQLRLTDNFCFLKTAVADRILKQLANTLAEIDENYGSPDLIVDNFETLEKAADFQKRFEKMPIDFFAAVRFLQMSGAPVKDGLVFNGDSRNRINAALLIAHYLTAANRDGCDAKGELFGGAAATCEYCQRLEQAKKEQKELIGGGRESLRGSYVFGIYDGVTRWAPAMMGKEGCFIGKDLATFASDSDRDKKFGRDQIKRVGIVPEEKICPWNPADHRHEVPTLLIKGSRDTVVAGCQAEDFFTNGLQEGRRVFFEIRGLGHDVSVANMVDASEASAWSKTFAGLLEDFIKMSSNPSAFRSANPVRAKLKKLMATDRTADPSIGKCGKMS